MADDQVWHAIDRLADHIAVLGVRFAAGGDIVAHGSPVSRPDLQRLYDYLRQNSGTHGWIVSNYDPASKEIFGSAQFKSVRRPGALSHRNISIRLKYTRKKYVVTLVKLTGFKASVFEKITDAGVKTRLDEMFPPIYAVSAGHSGTALGKEMQYTRRDGIVCRVDVKNGKRIHVNSDDGEEYELESVSSGDDDGTQKSGGEDEEDDEEGEGENEEDEEEDEEDEDSDGK